MKPPSSHLVRVLSTLQLMLKKLTVITSDVYGLDKTFRVLQYTVHLLTLYLPHRKQGGEGERWLSVALQKSLVTFSTTRYHLRLFSLVHLLAHPQWNWTYLSLLVYSVSEGMYWCHEHGWMGWRRTKRFPTLSRSTQLSDLTDHPKGKVDHPLDGTENDLVKQTWSEWSCRAWAVWILVQWSWTPNLNLVTHVCDLPLALHWSRSSPQTPFLNESSVAWLGWLGGVASFCKAYQAVQL
ncbi:hypothetical protein HMI54_012848 [Coelomomyces lativittatus]|nr:hypothetical protein HMI56_004433 [Coelomomyces lativittatus]KAJ1511435.1 hypothetical protein HMI55_006598 [Coelomomyces lativittatus]KAJ1515138.1 hypothetical protein HMI54_012848 [Coelomomyces lativittatus]